MEHTVTVQLKDMPDFGELKKKVDNIVHSKSWMEKYGVDWLFAVGAMIAAAYGFYLLKVYNNNAYANNNMAFLSAIFILGCSHGILSNKCGHLAAHGAMTESRFWNRFWRVFFLEFIGSFSTIIGDDIHVKMHHPHTNIIGLGDSSTWKAPMLPCYLYMFVAPLTVPILIPIVAVYNLWGRHKDLLQCLAVVMFGWACHFAVLMYYCGYAFWSSFLILFGYRAVLAVPYIHINIFQHVGLPMYSPKNRPVRIYQMATGCLNLNGNLFLNTTFGHSLLSCHIEHHLFPRLSDNMCLTVKPIVEEFLKKHNLPYQEQSYSGRLKYFLKDYEKLMVNAPPITHFVGLQ